MLTLKDRVDRQRRMLHTAARHPRDSALVGDLQAYAGYYRKVYDAARELTGARVVVDSSKVAPTALALSHHRGIDLRVLHLARDSRGVAYSWSKSVARPETEGSQMMPRLSALSSTSLWSSHNLEIQGLRHRGVPVVRIRYEDLVADPGPVVERAWRDLGLAGSGRLPLEAPSTIDLSGTHSVAGNPMRFATGRTALRPDTEWQERMSPRDRWTVTALSLPVLAWLGYVGRRRSEQPGNPGCDRLSRRVRTGTGEPVDGDKH